MFFGCVVPFLCFMSKKKGRPKQAVRQEKNIGFYLTWDQYAIVQRKAAEARVNISDYMRQVALEAEVKAKWTEEERGMVKMLIGMSVELHRLAEAAVDADGGSSAIGDPDVSGGTCGSASFYTEPAAFFGGLRDRLDEIIKNLCHAR